MKQVTYVRRGRLQDMDGSEDLKYWLSQPPAARLAALEQIRQEYHHWKYDSKPEFQKVVKIIKINR